MKLSCSISTLATLTLLASCLAEEPAGSADLAEPGEVTALAAQASSASAAAPGLAPGLVTEPEWYYTCSAVLLGCSPGYGAVEWIPYPDCVPYGSSYRLKCVLGAENP